MESILELEPQSQIFAVTSILLLLVFLIVIIHDIIKKIISKHKADEESTSHTSIDLFIMTYLNVFLILLYMISLLIRYILPFFPFLPNLISYFSSNCQLISEINIILFQIIRATMFTIFIRRIQVIYSDTIFSFKPICMYLLYGLILIYLLPYISYFDWTLFIESQYETFSCSIIYSSIISKILFFFASILDVFISSFCLYLFVYPLYQLLEHQDDDIIKNEIYNVMIKYLILYSTTIISSLILTIISFIFPFGFYYGIFDGLINGIMLIYLHPIHNTAYKRLCCIFHYHCIKCCNKIHDLNLKQLAIESTSSIQKDKRLQLTRISVVNVPTASSRKLATPSNDIQTPILLEDNVSTIRSMYKNAAQLQPARSNTKYTNENKRVKNVKNLIAVSINNMNKKTESKSKINIPHRLKPKLQSKITSQSLSNVNKQVQKKQYIHSESQHRKSKSSEIKTEINIRDELEKEIESKFKNKMINLTLNTNDNIKSHASKRSNTLQFIDYASTDL